MSNALLIKEIEKMAVNYMRESPTQLEARFLREWKAIARKEGVPVRGDLKEFWRGVANRLINNFVKNRAAVSATLGYITAEVVTYLEGLGVNLTAYKIPIAIFVALVAKSIFDQLESNQSN